LSYSGSTTIKKIYSGVSNNGGIDTSNGYGWAKVNYSKLTKSANPFCIIFICNGDEDFTLRITFKWCNCMKYSNPNLAPKASIFVDF
jgi:hypothetical protein